MSSIQEGMGKASNAFQDLVRNIPGYKGYKDKQDRREADKLLRLHIAGSFDTLRRRISTLQTDLTEKGQLSVVMTLERALMKLQLLIDRLKTATYGYTGLFDQVKVDEKTLDALYNFDASLEDGVIQLSKSLDLFPSAPAADINKLAGELVMTIDALNERFNERQDLILGLRKENP
ncbi:MAG: hypothetical protein HY326_06575 [Chloroflexi bacterium]|nr:hypothetical protein [Chloroflexota bacterium]